MKRDCGSVISTTHIPSPRHLQSQHDPAPEKAISYQTDGAVALRQHRLHHLAEHIRQPVMSALELEGELCVIDAEAVEDGRVQVVHIDGIARDVVAEVIGLAMRDATLDAAAGHPDGEAAGMMIATIVVRREPSLAIDCAAKFAAPYDERIVEQTTLF